MTADTGIQRHYSDSRFSDIEFFQNLPSMFTEFWGSPVNSGLRSVIFDGAADNRDRRVVPRQLEIGDHLARPDMGIGKNIGSGIDRAAGNFASQRCDDFLSSQP